LVVPRRVLYVAWAPFFSGAERALLLTITHLDRSRYEPVVVVGTDGELAAQLRSAGIPVEVCAIRYLDLRHPIAWLASVTRLWRLARRARPQLIHANDVPSFQPAGYVARLTGVPAVTHVRFPDERRGFAWFLRSGFARALFVSRALETDAVSAAPDLFGGRTDVVHDGVVVPPLTDQGTRARIRSELGLAVEKTVVALTGQVSEVKGIWEFVDASARVAAAQPAVEFAVLGDDLKGRGALRREMEQRVAALGLASRFRFLGFRPNAPALLPAFDLIAVPSHVEPLGNATLEAMAAGLPVVGSRVGGIPEMVVDGETGLLVPPRDATRLAEALGALTLDPERRRAMGAAGRRRAVEVFGLERHCDRVQEIYDGLLSDQRRG
jgi:glycosyltransferase involved in cell wall biosynthesis